MKKVTGKVVSLVLALALVVTSFSATFAFAATKTETGTAEIDGDYDEVWLVNGGSGNTAKFNLSDWIAKQATKLETYDHYTMTGIEISSVSSSNSSKLSAKKDSSDDKWYATIRNSNNTTGDVTLNILFKATMSGGRDGDEDDITVRGTDSITVHILDKDDVYLGKGAVKDSGLAPDGVDDFVAVNVNASGTQEADTQELKVFTVAPDSASALAIFTASNAIKDYGTGSGFAKDDYVVRAQSNVGVKKTAAGTGTLTYSTDATKQSSGTVTYNVYKATDTNKVGKSLLTKKVSVLPTVKTAYTSTIMIEKGLDNTGVTVIGTSSTTLAKSKTYAKVAGSVYVDVGSRNVKATAAGITMSSGSTKDLQVTSDGKKILVEDGNVGEIKGSGDSAKLDVDVTGGVVSKIAEGKDVEISGGKVGDVTVDGDVTVAPANDESPATVGAVEAKSLTVNSSEDAKASVTSFLAKGANQNVTLAGEMTTIGSINFDYYDCDLIFTDAFKGTVEAPTKAGNGAIVSDNEDVKATVTGNLGINTISLDNGTVKFDGSVRVANVEGTDGTMVINAGKLEITESISTSNTLKLADPATVVAGQLVFKAATDVAAIDSFNTFGFTVKLNAGKTTDSFVVDATSFAGVVINKTSSKIVLNNEETFTWSAYAAGTKLPEGASVKWDFDGDSDYFTTTENENGSITVKAVKYDSIFNSLNQGTLKAEVVDEYGDALEDYEASECDITIIEKPEQTYKSDTTGNVTIDQGKTYQFKITSLDGKAPYFAVAGGDKVFKLVAQSNTGNDYFFKVQAVGKTGEACGIYINSEPTPVAVMHVGASATSYTSDTKTVNVKVGGSYVVKLTSATKPAVVAAGGKYSVTLTSQNGNDYFFRITANNAKAGDVVGFYVNSEATPAFVATTVA